MTTTTMTMAWGGGGGGGGGGGEAQRRRRRRRRRWCGAAAPASSPPSRRRGGRRRPDDVGGGGDEGFDDREGASRRGAAEGRDGRGGKAVCHLLHHSISPRSGVVWGFLVFVSNVSDYISDGRHTLCTNPTTLF